MNRKPLPIHGVDVTAERPLTGYRVTVTVGCKRQQYVAIARSWYCAWLSAIEQFGIEARIVVRIIDKDAPCLI